MLRLKDKIEASVTYADRAGSATMADSANAVAWGSVSGKPSTFPPSWHTHSKSDVGLGNVDNTADSAKSVNYAASAGSAGYVAWGNVGGKPSTFTPASHTHSSISMSARGSSFIGDGDNDAANGVGGAINNIKISSWYGVSFTTTCSCEYMNKTAVGINCRTGALSAASITANKVYNAVYNDYAEFFPRGEATEPGDIVALDLTADHESYIKATATSKIVAGVHSDEYAMLIGGDKVDDGNYVEKNLVNYIPVSLAGRVMCKVTGPVHRGDTIIVSEIPGVGIATDEENIPNKRVVGYVVEDDDRTDIRHIKIRVKG